MSDAKDLHKKAILEFDNREYEKAIEYAEKCKKAAEDEISRYNHAKGADAKAVKIEFSKEFEVKGLKELNINSGEEEKLSIVLKPNELGDVPLELKTTYKDAEGKEYSAENLFMLNVTEPAEEKKEEERRREEGTCFLPCRA